MTVQNNPSVVNYIGDGATTVYPFNYRILETVDVFTIVNDQLVTIGITVFMNADQEIQPGGEVHFDVPPLNEDRITLYRYINPDQEIDYTAYDSFPAETHELGLDKLTLLAQQDETLVDHAIHFSLEEDPNIVNSLIPPVPERTNRFMYFNEVGNLIMFEAIVSAPGVLEISIHPDSETMQRVNYPNGVEFPELEMLFNGPLGTVKLDEQGKIPLDLINFIGMRMLGPYRGDDLCPKQGDEGGECVAPDTRNPSQRFPELEPDFINGDYFAMVFLPPEVSGTMELYPEVGSASPSIVTVTPADAIVHLEEVIDPDSPPDILIHRGWYHIPGLIEMGSAEFIAYDDTGNVYVLGNNVQVALDTVDSHLLVRDEWYPNQRNSTRSAIVLADANLAGASGMYHLNSSAINTPAPGQAFTMLSIYQASDRIHQTAISASAPHHLFTRAYTGLWADWVRMVQEEEIEATDARVTVNEGAISNHEGRIAANEAAIPLKKDSADFLRTGDRLDIFNVPTA